MDEGALTQTTGQDIHYQAAQKVQLNRLDTRTATSRINDTLEDKADWGNVYVEARSITAVHQLDILANEIHLRAGANEYYDYSNHLADENSLLTRLKKEMASQSNATWQNPTQGPAKTYNEQQLENSILRGSSHLSRLTNSLDFDTQQGLNLSPLQSLITDLVNTRGNRQIDVLGHTTADYLFLYSLDENDDELILASIL